MKIKNDPGYAVLFAFEIHFKGESGKFHFSFFFLLNLTITAYFHVFFANNLKFHVRIVDFLTAMVRTAEKSIRI